MQADGICLTISHHHQESWNPAWKVNQVCMGLLSFWLQDEGTHGSVHYGSDYRSNPFSNDKTKLRKYFAMQSRQDVLDHPKYKEIFEQYAEAIGITEEPSVPAWEEIKQKLLEVEEAKDGGSKLEEKKRAEETARQMELAKQSQMLINNYFKMLRDKNLTRLVGLKPEQQKVVLMKA